MWKKSPPSSSFTGRAQAPDTLKDHPVSPAQFKPSTEHFCLSGPSRSLTTKPEEPKRLPTPQEMMFPESRLRGRPSGDQSLPSCPGIRTGTTSNQRFFLFLRGQSLRKMSHPWKEVMQETLPMAMWKMVLELPTAKMFFQLWSQL